MKINITINNNNLTATLNDSEAAKNFASSLPMILKLDDYAQSSKIKHLDRRLNTNDTPSGHHPKAGDIIYFEPLGNIAIAYKDSKYSDSLIKLGEIDGDISIFESTENLEATFKVVE